MNIHRNKGSFWFVRKYLINRRVCDLNEFFYEYPASVSRRRK